MTRTRQLTIECLNDNLKNMYKHVKNFGSDSGLDLYCEEHLIVPAHAKSFKIHLGIKVAFSHHASFRHKEDSPRDIYHGFMLLPRSSMGSKTALRLSNSVGIIDKGYRGELIAIVDNISNKDYHIHTGDRLFQIVPFDGLGIDQLILGNVNVTERGERGLGSTGR